MKKVQETVNLNMVLTNAKTIHLVVFIFLFQTGIIFGQMLSYDNFEGNKQVSYTAWTGKLDTAAKNPAPNQVNNSVKCAKYVRNEKEKFDFIKMKLSEKVTNVGSFATYEGTPQKIKMKVYTTAPVGTLIEIQLGMPHEKGYPMGINSQYQARTTITKGWEEVQFNFTHMPEGSGTSFMQINQITLLFNPNSATSDTYYFDDLTGPMPVAQASGVQKETIKSVVEK